MVVVALLSVYLVESVDLVSVYLVVNCIEWPLARHNIKRTLDKPQSDEKLDELWI